MTDPVQRAACQLADGSHLEVALTSPANKSGQTADLEAILNRLKSEIEATRLPKAQMATTRHGLVGKSSSMQALFRMIDKVASTQATVLITGENGTGKELVARAIHAGSSRAGKPFVAANVSAFNDNLLESELFGHRRGAFTGAVADKRGLFEEADTGTFLLDEVGDMSPALQAKLLRVLQEGTFLAVGGTQTRKVDVRIIAATNRDLRKEVESGRFREDLYYRLRVVELEMPPLRARREDIPSLAHAFLDRSSRRMSRELKGFTNAAMDRLTGYPWPGNVRELENEIERIVALAGRADAVGVEMLSEHIRGAAPPPPPATSGEPRIADLNQAVDALKRRMLLDAIRETGSKTRAAERLGIPRQSLQKMMKRLGIQDVGDN